MKRILTLVAVIKTKRNERGYNFVIMLICMVFIKLMLSGSYTTESTFYFMLGVFVTIARDKYTRKRMY